MKKLIAVMMWSLMLSVSTLAEGDTSMGESLTPPASCDCGTCVNNGAINQTNTDTAADPDALDPRNETGIEQR